MEKATILVVDDTPENIDILVGILGDDYKVKVAIDGPRALSLVAKTLPDLILLDVMMPEMDGFEFLQALRGMDKVWATADIPVIMLTACGDELEFVALERGADMFCEKFRAESLLVKQINFLLEM